MILLVGKQIDVANVDPNDRELNCANRLESELSSLLSVAIAKSMQRCWPNPHNEWKCRSVLGIGQPQTEKIDPYNRTQVLSDPHNRSKCTTISDISVDIEF